MQVFQRRTDGTLDLYQDWQAYKDWLRAGLRRALAGQRPHTPPDLSEEIRPPRRPTGIGMTNQRSPCMTSFMWQERT